MTDPMTGIRLEQGRLTCDGLALDELGRETGTPVHVYSAPAIRERYGALDAAFAGVPHAVHYALKANATLAVVRLARALGAGADANSGGEIEVALRAGFAPEEIVFTGVGKTPAEIERAVALGVRAINAESPGEVARIAAIAETAHIRARVAVRINPDVDAESHPHISTGLKTNKFGMSIPDARQLVREAARRPSLEIVGVHVHIGSQITSAVPLVRAATTLASFARELIAGGVALAHLDIGGGLGIAYEPGQRVLSAHEYAEAVVPVLSPIGLPIILEPGRWIVGPAGVLLTRVVDLKTQPDGRSFVVVDAGMTDLLRPALYGAWHGIEPVRPRPGAPIDCDVVGPVCETSDTLGAGRRLPPVEVGDLLAVRDTGAYGAVMASNYNRRPTAAEVMVDAGSWRIVRRRQTVDEMLQWDA
jgi:diaminopimelate decarboxylase